MSGSRVSKADLIRLARALGDVEAELDEESMGCIFERCMQRAEQLGAPASIYPLDHDAAHPIVRDWARRVIDGAVEHVLSCRMGDNEAARFAAGWVDSSVRKHAELDPATCTHTMRAGRCLRCGLSTVVSEAIGVSEAIDLMHREPLPVMASDPICADRSKAVGVRVGCFASHAHPNEPARCQFCDRIMLPRLALREDRTPEQLQADGDDDVAEYDRPAPEPRDEDGAPLNDWREQRRENAEQWAKTRGSKGGATTA